MEIGGIFKYRDGGEPDPNGLRIIDEVKLFEVSVTLDELEN